MGSKIASLDKLVDAYIRCGNRIGFFYAEFILMKYLPDDKPNGKCYDVPASDRVSLINELNTYNPEKVEKKNGR